MLPSVQFSHMNSFSGGGAGRGSLGVGAGFGAFCQYSLIGAGRGMIGLSLSLQGDRPRLNAGRPSHVVFAIAAIGGSATQSSVVNVEVPKLLYLVAPGTAFEKGS